MNRVVFLLVCALEAFLSSSPVLRGAERDLRLGAAGHAFDHLGTIAEQAEAAAASGATIIYASGLGALGYQGLPAPADLQQQRKAAAAYAQAARSRGIRLVIGYVCATSIVQLDSFDRNWAPQLRRQFRTPPAEWRQQDRDGRPLHSWYGGDYQPACMNNPDWRAYEKFIVRQQLESGCDGIFFDNPTVHPQGCYCPYCMEKFAQFLGREETQSTRDPRPSADSAAAVRELAVQHPNEFRRFRCTIARDFLAEMRRYARAIKPAALVTANNSLNSANALYAQCRTHAYNMQEMSRAEDFVVVEDMSNQPRTLPSGQTLEYGPTYEQLHAIAHGKPIVAVTIADGDYHTPPNLVRLAMAEAAAHGASYLSWPTWPESQRARMIAAIRPQAELLRQNERLLNDTRPRRDAALFLPFRRWLEIDPCAASALAAVLTQANVQYQVISEDAFVPDRATSAPSPRREAARRRSLPEALEDAKVLIAENRQVFTPAELKAVEAYSHRGGVLLTSENPAWLSEVQRVIGKPSVEVLRPPAVRAVARDQSSRCLLHLLNLGVQRLSSFEDKVTPASDVQLLWRVPFKRVRTVRALTADLGASSGPLAFSARREGNETLIEIRLPRVEIATLLVCEP